ncbi:ciliary microtubule inner protein 1-like [Liolophura sinensis]|uniref:ciliary microtubule inner protein 1-like n=1 Tax=Liolophura sinensis TaxID=3198878 RepID=UPI003159499C
MASPKAGDRPKTNLNVVHNEEIWKEHVRHETNSQLRIWPGRWGFLIHEYDKLDRILAMESPLSRASSTDKPDSLGFKLPPIPKVKALDPTDRYPLTTTQMIGWKSAKTGNMFDFYENAFDIKSRNKFALPKLTILDAV